MVPPIHYCSIQVETVLAITYAWSYARTKGISEMVRLGTRDVYPKHSLERSN